MLGEGVPQDVLLYSVLREGVLAMNVLFRISRPKLL